MQEEILEAVRTAVRELIRTAKLGQGDLLVVGCSSSEILGEAIGTHSSADAADAVVSALFPVLEEAGVALAAQCCEHLNRRMAHPAAVEHVAADAGMDIGDTLIGMHLKEVAVPVRLSVRKIGAANLVCARTRPKYIGGARAVYDEALM